MKCHRCAVAERVGRMLVCSDCSDAIDRSPFRNSDRPAQDYARMSTQFRRGIEAKGRPIARLDQHASDFDSGDYDCATCGDDPAAPRFEKAAEQA